MNYFLSFRTLFVTISILTGTLVASLIATDSSPRASIYAVPESTYVKVGDKLNFSIMVESNVPVNTFVGELIFNPDYFSVVDIGYNISIANLWVEEPWYNRDKDSIYFAGGTTMTGGFSGKGELMNVTLEAKTPGDTSLMLRNVRVLAHDGLGTDVPLTKPLDTLISVDTTPFAIPLAETKVEEIIVVQNNRNLDINSDGKLNFQDIGILLLMLGKNESIYDFNNDGSVTWADIRTWQELRKLQEI